MDQLAIAVGTQWEAEARVRRLNDPYPLAVSWDAADPSLTDTWESLVRLATSGAGWPPPPPKGTWAAGPNDLAGNGSELAEVLARVPTGRLVVLGEPGAGKTMLMVRLVLDLLARRVSGGPVPVLASLASWNPADSEQDLHGWLAAQLAIDYPFLAAAAPPGAGEGTCIEALLRARPSPILPILDGLDEIPDAVRGPAIARINDALKPGEQVVVTCRTKQYKNAIWPQGGVRTTVTAAAAVQLCPLDADAVTGYLRETGGPGAAKRWHPVLTALGTQEPVGQVLKTPLMIGLARTIYNPRAGEVTGELRDPAELCQLADRATVGAQLFDAFIPAAYRSGLPCPWTAEQAETWLVFLARHLEYTIRGPDLAWWQLVGAGVSKPPARDMRISIGGLLLGLAIGLSGFAFNLVFGLTLGLAFGLVGALVGTPGDLIRVTSPKAVFAHDRQVALVLWLLFGLASGLATGLIFGFAGTPVAGLIVGLATGFIGGFLFAAVETAWPSYLISRGSLALQRRLPWSLMDFLADAHQRGVLRQAGAVYQFRHIELQHRLANTSGRIGSGYDVSDENGDKYRVTLVKIIDPARGADQNTNPDSGKRLIGAVFRIIALKGRPDDVDANSDAAVIGSNGQTYSADLTNIAGYTNFDSGIIHVAQGATSTGSVTFQVPEGVKVAKVQWNPGGPGSTVQWQVRR